MKVINAMAFVDWKSQLFNAKTNALADRRLQAVRTLDWICSVVSRAIVLIENDDRLRFRVDIRLYYGWHRGAALTESRRAMVAVQNDVNFRLVGPNSKVLFGSHLEFGETLLSADPHRLVNQHGAGLPRIHLPDTYRKPLPPETRYREKMVDTALACDLIAHARLEPTDWRIVLAEDDDLVPALFVAEAWSKSKGGKNKLLRNGKGNKYLNLTGILMELNP